MQSQLPRRARVVVATMLTVLGLLAGGILAATPAAAEPARPVHDRIAITAQAFDGARFRLAGTAVPHTTLRVRTRLQASAPWSTATRTRVDRAGDWTARFRDPRPEDSAPTRRFWIRVEQVGSTTALEGRVSWSEVPDPTPMPDPAPTADPTPPPEPVPDPPVDPPAEPAAAPGGSATSFSFLHVGPAGTPARWNPCRPITYFVNASGLPDGERATVEEAFTRLAAVSGLTFVDGGGTDLIVGRVGSVTFDRGEGIYVSFADEATAPAVAGSVAGMARPYWVSASTTPRFVAGAVVIDSGAGLDPGFVDGTSLGAVLLHELGHVIGLGHVDDPSQLMNPYASAEGPADFQAGDRAGLQALLQGGCF